MFLKLGVKNKGFTLIEVLAVIVIIAIIAAIAVPAVKNILTESKRDTFGLSAQKILDGVLQQEALNDEFEATEVSVQNLKAKLKMSNANYQELIITETNDNEYYIYIEGKNKWKNLVVCGTHDDIIVESKDNIEVCLGVYEQQEKEEEGIPNHPVLAQGMVPIKWVNNDDGALEFVGTNVNDPDWYNYGTNNETRRWANAISKNPDTGETVAYWVWIPRFAYQITSCYHMNKEECLDASGKEAGEIKIVFLNNNTNKNQNNTEYSLIPSYNSKKNKQLNFIVHPAFTFGNIELPGIWVAKYKVSSGGYILPEKSSDGDHIGNMFIKAREMETNLQYGWDIASDKRFINGEWDGTFINDTNNLDTHLLKNTEWGAVAYLAQSKYGKNDKININQSSTGNVYGVYGMSGGAIDYIAAYIESGPAENLYGFGAAVVNANLKYKNVYNGGNDGYNANMWGDALYETSNDGSSWYGEDGFFLGAEAPWFVRPGGAFSFFSHFNGSCSGAAGWRVALIVEN